MHRSSFSRRRFAGLAAGAGIALSQTATHRTFAQTPTAIGAFTESPMLTALVDAGTLPPVTERLPVSPMVVQPLTEVGAYGGMWRHGLLSTAGYNAIFTRTIGYDFLMRWDLAWTEPVPNIAEAVEQSADAREYTFTLREGMKWSDGAPFTSDDVVFYIEDVHKNPELTPSRGVNPPEIEKLDDRRFTVRFADPDGLFLQKLATPNGAAWTRYPAHYLKPFHKTYNTDNLDQLIAEAGAQDWVELFQTRGGGISGTPYDARWQNADLPTLLAWRLTEPFSGTSTRVVGERNPYYFKVDPQGQQLPYMDRIEFPVSQDAEVMTLQALNGEIDMQTVYIGTNTNKPVLAEAQETAGFGFFETIQAEMNTSVISLNLTHPDPALRAIFQNKDFRIGLSHAINRQEIIDVVYVAQGEPWQAAPLPDSGFYRESMAKQFTEYDLDLANTHLDKVVPDRDDRGFRLRPDGQRLFITFSVASNSQERIDAMNLVVGYWAAVGIEATINVEDNALFYNRKEANEHDCNAWAGDGGLGCVLEPRWYFPFSAESNFAPAWYVWYAQPASPKTPAEEPPESTRRQMDLYRQVEAAATPDEQAALFDELLAIAEDQFYTIGISTPSRGYGIVKTALTNVPAEMYNAWLYPTPAPTQPEQYAWKA